MSSVLLSCSACHPDIAGNHQAHCPLSQPSQLAGTGGVAIMQEVYFGHQDRGATAWSTRARAALRELENYDPAWDRLPRELRRRIATLLDDETGA